MKTTMGHNIYKIIIICLGLAVALPLIAADSGQINYQARLLDAYGRRVNDTVDLSFKIYDASNNVLWTETQPGVVVQDGVYSIVLGSQTAIPASVFSQNNVYLELGINGETMSPRQQITASAYALVARTIMGSNVYEDQTSGNVGVGTLAPGAKLDVSGTVKATGFKMPTGATANYVLVSDSEGVGTWQSMSVVITETDPIHTNWVRVAFAPVTNDLWNAIGARALQSDVSAATNDMWASAAGINARVLASTYEPATGALWAAVGQRVLRGGDIMTGPLTNAVGIYGQYFAGDGGGLTNISSSGVSLTGVVHRIGDTMTGPLVVSNNVVVTGTNEVGVLFVTNAIILQDAAAITNWLGLTNETGGMLGVVFTRRDVGITNIADGVVTNAQIAAGAVTESKLADGSVTATKIGPSAVVLGKIDNLAVAESNIANLAVTSGKIGPSAVTLGKIANFAVADSNIVSATNWNNAVVNKAGIAGDAIAYANVYYFGVNGSWSNASAASSATARGMLGLALGGAIATDGMLLNGQCANGWGFDPGSILYLSTNVNEITATRPMGTNHIVRIVGYAVNASTIFFNPDRTYIEIVGE
jgi:hypothetical protein